MGDTTYKTPCSNASHPFYIIVGTGQHKAEGRKLKPVFGKGREYEARQAEFVRFMTNLDKLKLLPSNTFGSFLGPSQMGEENEVQMTRSSC
jgi:hypothetical protein